MHKNPFSPSFSIRPERFYGRRRELSIMSEALSNPDSANRYLFVTGTRGSGKTSLLHQFCLLAQESGWTVLEATYQNAMEVLRAYGKADTNSDKRLSVAPAISAVGVSASLFEMTHAESSGTVGHLAQSFVREASRPRHRGGTFIAIDEVQKISEQDMEEICHAVQQAKTNGLNVALVIAGLPASYQRIRNFRGCTFVQRMARLRLGMMGVAETMGFLQAMFALVPEISIAEGQRAELAQFSAGHPYLLQLLGSSLYETASELVGDLPTGTVTMRDEAIRDAEQCALGAYQRNVLHTLLSDTREGTRAYVRAMCEVCDENSTAYTSAIAHALGKTVRECSPSRARVIDLQLAYPVERGKLRFAVPYVPLVFASSDESNSPDPADTWAPRAHPFA